MSRLWLARYRKRLFESPKASATALGGVIAVTTEISHGYLAPWSSLFAGMLIISTIKEKVPGSADARFGPFLLGVLGYSSLLLLTEIVSF